MSDSMLRGEVGVRFSLIKILQNVRNVQHFNLNHHYAMIMFKPLRRLSLAQALALRNVNTTFVKSMFFLYMQEPLKSLSFLIVKTQPTAFTHSVQS
jgi:hypothetical protein